ncbi:site-specific integrase [Stenotrophomonas maltophilia]|uniref:site-specific integrase n=1 Tax=Stenotrophomonas maltophilia TaxID=40324 RepID=UPI0009BCEA40|nr:site-specific integrase [Stenotrophomonas maltophilia]
MRKIIDGQLFALTEEDFRVPHFVDHSGNLHTRDGGNIPLVYWPDGRWCHHGNSFVLHLLEKGQSRRNRGGTLAVTASNISHLIRYCWKVGIEITDLDDNHFREFIDGLCRAPHASRPGQLARSSNTVIAIGRSCLQFLSYVAEATADTKLIGQNGRVRATSTGGDPRRRYEDAAGRNRKPETDHPTWTHPSFPIPSAKRRRLPISTKNIERLREAASHISTTAHQRMRRQVMLTLLESTLGRRSEINEITPQAIQEALMMDVPMIELATLKRRVRSVRQIPIPRSDLEFISQYITFYRSKVARQHPRVSKKVDGLLLNDRTGRPINSETITGEIRLLRQAAGISEQACAHMFRHRGITKFLVALIEQYEPKSADDFRNLLTDIEALKHKTAEFTGHADISSLDPYIDLAFDEVTDFKKSYDLARASSAIESFKNSIRVQISELEHGGSAERTASAMESLADALLQDLALTRSE